jgi:hypothetical protein
MYSIKWTIIASKIIISTVITGIYLIINKPLYLAEQNHDGRKYSTKFDNIVPKEYVCAEFFLTLFYIGLYIYIYIYIY